MWKSRRILECLKSNTLQLEFKKLEESTFNTETKKLGGTEKFQALHPNNPISVHSAWKTKKLVTSVKVKQNCLKFIVKLAEGIRGPQSRLINAVH